MLVGQATRLAQFLDKDQKEYEATIRFGFETDTGDLTGEMRDEGGRMNDEEVAKVLSQTNWEEVFSHFRGEIEQTPPMYSAKKVEGKKLYELARKGIEIERKPVNITIYELEERRAKGEGRSSNRISIRVSCSAGTYIRTLAEDIGRKISVPCHLSALRRTRAGKFSIEQAITLENIENAQFISMNEALSHLPEISLNEEQVKKIRNGMKLPSNLKADFVRLTDEENNLIAIGVGRENFVQPKIVFV
jgi:tRNA pseudouridine55 synthase